MSHKIGPLTYLGGKKGGYGNPKAPGNVEKYIAPKHEPCLAGKKKKKKGWPYNEDTGMVTLHVTSNTVDLSEAYGAAAIAADTAAASMGVLNSAIEGFAADGVMLEMAFPGQSIAPKKSNPPAVIDAVAKTAVECWSSLTHHSEIQKMVLSELATVKAKLEKSQKITEQLSSEFAVLSSWLHDHMTPDQYKDWCAVLEDEGAGYPTATLKSVMADTLKQHAFASLYGGDIYVGDNTKVKEMKDKLMGIVDSSQKKT